MDKYEYRIKTEQMLKLVDQKDYQTAMKIADSIEWRRVKSVSMLCTVSDIYEKNERFEDARDILLIAYGRSPIGRMILYRLAELAVKMEDFEEAIECYEEFIQVAPKDSSQYILQYKICRGQGQPLEKLIEILERYRQVDYRERWAYELAELYHEAGMPDKCVEICDDLILWFSEGEYVIKAMELKMNYKPLSPMQQKKYDKRNEYERLTQAVAEKLEEPGVDALDEKRGVEREEQEFKEAVQKLEEHTYDDKEPDPSTTADIERILQGHKVDIDDMPGAEEPEKPTGFFGRLFGRRSSAEDDFDEMDAFDDEELEAEPEAFAPEVEEEMEIEPVQVNVGPYDTMNLQKELAENMAQLLGTKDAKNGSGKEHTRELKEVEEALKELGATADVAEMLKEVVAYEAAESSAAAEYQEEVAEPAARPDGNTRAVWGSERTGRIDVPPQTEPLVAQRTEPLASRRTEPLVSQQTAAMSEPLASSETGAAVPKRPEYQQPVPRQNYRRSPLEENLAEEGDGQISLFIPEQPEVEKQITGQLTLDEILAEWEKTRKATEEAIIQAEKKQQEERLIRQETGDLYKRAGAAIPTVPDDVQQLMKELEEELKDSGMLQQGEKKAAVTPEPVQPEPAVPDENLGDTKEFETPSQLFTTKEFTRPGAATPDLSAALYGAGAGAAAGVGAAAGFGAAFEPAAEMPEPEIDFALNESEAAIPAADFEMSPSAAATPEPAAVVPEPEVAVPEPAAVMPEPIQPDLAESEPEADDLDFGETQLFEKVDRHYVEPAMPSEEEEEEEELEQTRVIMPEADEEAENGPTLTAAQKKLFSYFVPVKGMSEQLAAVLEADRNCKTRQGTSSTGNILLVGRSGSGKTMLAINLVKAIQHARRMRTGKLAKISAASLNKKLVREVLAKLHGGSLIIEQAGDLADDTVRDLNRYMEGRTEELLVILEDQRKPLERMLRLNPNFAKKFTSRVEVPIFINDELVTFGKAYARELGCKIDDMGILALYTRIDEQQRDDHAVTVAEVKEIIDEAIEHATNSGVKKIVSVFRKHPEEAEIILKEHDFGV